MSISDISHLSNSLTQYETIKFNAMKSAVTFFYNDGKEIA